MTEKSTVAKLIKKELSAAFPLIKFSVKATLRGWNSTIEVIYSGNLNRKLIYDSVEKYRRGHFNAMTDSYDLDNLRDDILQVDYIFISQTNK